MLWLFIFDVLITWVLCFDWRFFGRMIGPVSSTGMALDGNDDLACFDVILSYDVLR